MELGYGFGDLQDPSIDLAFRLGHVNDDRLVARPPGEFRRILAASPQCEAGNMLKQPADLVSADCLVFSAHANIIDWTLRHRPHPEKIERIRVQGRIAVLGFTVLLGAAEAGTGVGYIPEFVARRAIEDGTLVHCLSDWASRPMPVFIAYRFGVERIGRVKAVIDAARQFIPGLLGSSSNRDTG